MQRCFIFGSAPISGLPVMPKDNDFVIAADGGLLHLRRLGIKADIIIGDFDSLSRRPDGDNVIVHPAEKDATDMALAISEAVSRGATQIFLYGGVGGNRLDHTVANMQTVCYYAQRGVTCYLIGGGNVITAIHNQSVAFSADADGIVSVFCNGVPATGVSLTGLKYPLDRVALSPVTPLGVSNEFQHQPAEISVEYGTLMLIFDEKNLSCYSQYK